MDKLELDSRVASLERKMTFFSAATLVGLVALAGISILALISRRAGEQAATVTANVEKWIGPVEPPQPVPTPMLTPILSADHETWADSQFGQLTAQIRELGALRSKSLLSDSEFQQKKQRLLDKNWEPSRLTLELETIESLKTEGLLTSSEFDKVRAKILESVK
jgi:hypothetical protein